MIGVGEEVKVLALFSIGEDEPYIVGKLKIRITYEMTPSNDDLGK